MILAPTAGGKTEASMLPTLSGMVDEQPAAISGLGSRRRQLIHERIPYATWTGHVLEISSPTICPAAMTEATDGIPHAEAGARRSP
jgi:hypothetical protein